MTPKTLKHKMNAVAFKLNNPEWRKQKTLHYSIDNTDNTLSIRAFLYINKWVEKYYYAIITAIICYIAVLLLFKEEIK